MSKKKIAALIVAAIMTVGVVGGTLAWFTSEDSVTNVFETGKVTQPDGGNGVEIYEKFTPPTNLVPGDTTDKLVQIKNTTSYDSFIRVKITPTWVDGDGEVDDTLPVNNIGLNFVEGRVVDIGKIEIEGEGEGKTIKNVGSFAGKWVEYDGYYYYINKVAGGGFTNTLLKSVKFNTIEGNSKEDNDYRGKTFNVKVDADSIQADNEAYTSWNGSNDGAEKINLLLKYYSGQTAVTVEQADGVTVTN